MKIVIINGSHRKNGATALILNEMYEELKKHSDVEIQIIHVSDLSLVVLRAKEHLIEYSKKNIKVLRVNIGKGEGVRISKLLFRYK